MGNSDIDKYFKDQLKGYSKEVDTDAIWSALDLQGEKKKKKRPFLLWCMGLSLLIAFVVVYYRGSSIDTQQKYQDIINKNAKMQIDEQDNALTNVAPAGTAGTLLNTNSTSTPLQNLLTKTKEINGPKNNKSISNAERNIEAKVESNLSISFESSTTIVSTEAKNDQAKNTLSQKNAIHEHSIVHNIPTNNNTLTNSVQGLSIDTLQINDTRHLVLPIALMSMKLLDIPEWNISTTTPKIVKNENRRKNTKWSLDVYSGVYVIDRTLSSLNSVAESFLINKERYETPLELFSVGAQLKCNIGSIYLKSGIEFQSLNEQFKFEQRVVLDTITSTNIFIGDSQEELVMNSRWLHNNNHRLYTIPLSIGYERRVNNWYFSLEANTSFIFHRSFAGRQLSQAGTVVNDFDDVNNSFRLGYGASFGFRYAFTKTTSVYLRPHYFTFKDLYISQSLEYSKNYNLYGLQMGLNFKL